MHEPVNFNHPSDPSNANPGSNPGSAANSAYQALSPEIRVLGHGLSPALGDVSLEEDYWETVDFPGAIQVETLPEAEPAGQPTQLPVAEEQASIALDQVSQENAQLKQRLAQVEQALVQAQVELQLELTRSPHAQQTPIDWNALPQDLPTAQAHVLHLKQQLQQTEQTAQQQQSLLDSLHNELSRRQDQLTQLEQACDSLQQNSAQQAQQLEQLELTNRDLRMRLHRQQQKALQFKVALEKSLESPATTSGRSPLETEDVTDLMPKAQPVQPWSTAGESIHTASGAVVKPLSKLLNLDGASVGQPMPSNPVSPEPAIASVPEVPMQQMGELLAQIFPSDGSSQPIPAPAAPQETVFDLSPFLATGEVSASGQVSQPDLVAPAPEANSGYEPEPTPQSRNLWDDLAQLIDPALLETAMGNETLSPAEASPVATPPQVANPVAPAPVRPLKPVAMPPHVPAATTAHTVEPAIAPPSDTPRNDLPWSFNLKESEAPDEESYPAPTLNPQRPAKKLKSLAAVDLPTFPRSTPN
jgi:hypothetical protein